MGCLYEKTCALFEQQKILNINLCDDFLDIEMDCLTDCGEWKEFSWNKYTDNILDYGEETEWDKFLQESYM